MTRPTQAPAAATSAEPRCSFERVPADIMHRYARRQMTARTPAGSRRQTQNESRGEVAEAGLEAAGHAVGARGRGRSDQPRQRRRKADEPRQAPARAIAWFLLDAGPSTQADGQEHASSEDGGQRTPEAVVEARQEPVGPDAAVGEVAEDEWASRPPRACSGAGRSIGPRCWIQGSGLPLWTRLRRYQ